MKPAGHGQAIERSGRALREVREEIDLTRELAAHKAGVGAGYLYLLEQDIKPITDSAVMKIARGWELSVDWLDDRLRRAAGNERARRRRTA